MESIDVTLCVFSRRESPKRTAEMAKPIQKISVFQHLNEDEISKTYEEWMKIAADNVSSFFSNGERKEKRKKIF